MSLREQVYELDGGRCIATGVKLSRRGDHWQWQVHHPVPQNVLKREGYGHLCRDPRFGVLVSRQAHMDHHGIHPIPMGKLPARFLEAVAELPGWAEVRLERAHPR
jgi:hypothetical protein